MRPRVTVADGTEVQSSDAVVIVDVVDSLV